MSISQVRTNGDSSRLFSSLINDHAIQQVPDSNDLYTARLLDKVAQFAKILDRSQTVIAHQHRSIHTGRVHRIQIPFKRHSQRTKSRQDQISPKTPSAQSIE